MEELRQNFNLCGHTEKNNQKNGKYTVPIRADFGILCDVFEGKAPVTRSEPAQICGFFGQNAVSQISSHCFKDFFCSVMKKSMSYVKDELFPGLKLTNLGKNYIGQRKKLGSTIQTSIRFGDSNHNIEDSTVVALPVVSKRSPRHMSVKSS